MKFYMILNKWQLKKKWGKKNAANIITLAWLRKATVKIKLDFHTADCVEPKGSFQMKDPVMEAKDPVIEAEVEVEIIIKLFILMQWKYLKMNLIEILKRKKKHKKSNNQRMIKR